MTRAIDDVDLIIFDCDGVVADSEPLATRVLQEALRLRGVDLTIDEIIDRFLGRSAETMARVLKADFDIAFEPHETEAMRQRLFEVFEQDLQPVAGVKMLLARLGTPFCLASSSQMERIEATLRTTGCAHFFAGRIFSAAMVAHGKPAPDLFLHAARTLGAAPERCLVIEDSPAGIEAARRADMRVIAFLGGGHAVHAGHRRAVAASSPDYTTQHMEEVAGLLGVNLTADKNPAA